jgi:hypothetical protein
MKMNEIKQVKATFDYEVASELLSKGWELIKILSIKENENSVRERYILATTNKKEKKQGGE